MTRLQAAFAIVVILLGLSIVGHLDRQTALMLEAPALTDDLPQPERMRCT